MGSVFNRGSKHRPNWYAKYRDLDGAWRMVPSHMPTKEQARRFVEAIEARIAARKVGIVQPTTTEVAQERVTVRELGERFLSEYSSPRVKDVAKYRREVGYLLRRHLFPVLGDVRASEVTRAHLDRLRDAKLQQGLSNQTVKHVLAYTSRLYNWARAMDHVAVSNPVQLVDKPSLAGRDSDLDFLSQDEVQRLLAWSAEEQPKEYPVYITAMYTGMRMGELYGLRWADVNFERSIISVRRSYRSTPKSGKTRRVPVNPRLAPVLRAWRARCPETAEGLTFPTVRGYMRDKDRDYGFKSALTGARCHTVRFHGLRHTFASHFIMSGGNILTLQRLLGHSSVSVTMKYAHLAPDYMHSEVNRLSFDARTAEVVNLAERRPERETVGPAASTR